MEPKYESLYQRGLLSIRFNGETGEHRLCIRGNTDEFFVLPRGTLDEIAHSDETSGFAKIRAFNDTILGVLSQKSIPYSNLHIAITQARLNEVEKERDYWLHESQNKK